MFNSTLSTKGCATLDYDSFKKKNPKGDQDRMRLYSLVHGCFSFFVKKKEQSEVSWKEDEKNEHGIGSQAMTYGPS